MYVPRLSLQGGKLQLRVPRHRRLPYNHLHLKMEKTMGEDMNREQRAELDRLKRLLREKEQAL